MIAPTSHRRQGLGRATILTFLHYILRYYLEITGDFERKEGVPKLALRELKVKIGSKNEKSLRLFESIGFVKVREEPNYFGELELVIVVEEFLKKDKIREWMEKWNIRDYEELWYGKRGDR